MNCYAFQKGNLLPRILPLTIARSAIELRGSLTYNKNTVNKIEENEQEKLNMLLITDYAKVENKEQKRWQPHASHDCSTFQAFK